MVTREKGREGARKGRRRGGREGRREGGKEGGREGGGKGGEEVGREHKNRKGPRERGLVEVRRGQEGNRDGYEGNLYLYNMLQ